MTTTEHATPMFELDDVLPPAGHPERFGTRWRLVGAGLSDVWRYGDLTLPATSGRLLLRGPNGTGKTTALEALWPYLLDLNPLKLNAGKARTTTLKSLMREGASGKRRFGYMWLTLAGPGSDGEWTYGVRLQYSDSTPVTTVPFVIPGRPLRDLDLHGPARASLNVEDFTARVIDIGGQVFNDEDDYRTDLAARVWSAQPDAVRDLAARLRVLRNPSLLGDLSAVAAADALRAALPTVNSDVVTATADALAESDATRDAFARDEEAAVILSDFAQTWTGHVTAVLTDAHTRAHQSAVDVTKAERELKRLQTAAAAALTAANQAKVAAKATRDALRDAVATRDALKDSDAYKADGALRALRTTRDTKQELAATQIRSLVNAAEHERDRTKALLSELGELSRDIDDVLGEVANADHDLAPTNPLLTWTTRPRAVLVVGDNQVDPGPAVTTSCDLDQLRSHASAWTDAATRDRTRAADALIAIKDRNQAVVPAEDDYKNAKEAHARADGDADQAQSKHQREDASAREAAIALCAEMTNWTKTPNTDALSRPTPQLQATSQLSRELEPDVENTTAWTVSDVADLIGSEPGQTLAQASTWRDLAYRRAATAAAEHRAKARENRARATELESDASILRTRAAELRSGKLLPMPRPAWVNHLNTSRAALKPPAQPLDESNLLGAALDWVPAATTETERSLIEAALAATGLLGATINAHGAHTADWTVSPIGPAHTAGQTLATVVFADPAHHAAGVVTAILERIALEPAVNSAQGTTGLVIGRNGTFGAGPTLGYAPGAKNPDELTAASHIGARQRREAALAHAVELTLEADELELTAQSLNASAAALDLRALSATKLGDSFPDLDVLRDAERRRSNAAQDLTSAREHVTHCAEVAREAKRAATRTNDEWITRTRARGLPIDLEDLTKLNESATHAARDLTRAAKQFNDRLIPRATRLRLGAAPATGRGTVSVTPSDLTSLATDARTAHDAAARAAVSYSTLQGAAGADAAEAVRQFAVAQANVDTLEPKQVPADQFVVDTASEAARLEENVTSAANRLGEARPTAQVSCGSLITLLQTPGVSEALAPVQTTGAPDEWWSADPVHAVGLALTGRTSVQRRKLRETYDAARAALIGTWTLDPADSVAELETYVLTHDDLRYDPHTAAARATVLRDRAQIALHQAEEEALRDFVIGRLPAAIGVAWTSMHDWAQTVNRKMRSAASSSGVGVQVRVRLADDLSPAAHTVYQLSCTVADADRAPDQKLAVGTALTQLISAATGDTMHDRIAEAVDVRTWVTIHYEIDRGTGKLERWGSKTALSGGERRLVVLAPMLAAVAAGFDSLGETGLRLAALDEVPAEVDERGREGLARYLAELDLDLIATSYLWDGAPGAWDGIDAHDLEAGSDGTVVAFPMLVRGMTTLPGDPIAPESNWEPI